MQYVSDENRGGEFQTREGASAPSTFGSFALRDHMSLLHFR